MTNLEFYEKELGHVSFAVVNNHVKNCGETSCGDCLFKGVYSCAGARCKWLNEEHKEPFVDWAKIAVNTPILVSSDGQIWHNRYFARFEDDMVYAWDCGATKWSAEDYYNATNWKYARLWVNEV